MVNEFLRTPECLELVKRIFGRGFDNDAYNAALQIVSRT
jgi:hypothetical protein